MLAASVATRGAMSHLASIQLDGLHQVELDVATEGVRGIRTKHRRVPTTSDPAEREARSVAAMVSRANASTPESTLPTAQGVSALSVRERARTRHVPTGGSLPEAVLALQPSAGNAAVARVPSKRVLQRNGTSSEVMVKLSEPQVFPGPTGDVPAKIAANLDAEIAKLPDTEQRAYKANTCVGGIRLTSVDADVDTLIKTSRLEDLEGSNRVGKSSWDLVQKAGVERLIVENTLKTMETAGQLEYLQRSGMLKTGSDCEAVLVEVHYYWNRSTEQTRFHKDTSGQTLFVNLNFVNEEPILGPEFVINPGSHKEYDDYVERALPKTFVEDVKAAKDARGKPKSIGATTVPKMGVVTFVDELIHHKTPTRGHRKASKFQVVMMLNKSLKEAYEDAQQAYAAFTTPPKQSMFSGWFSSPAPAPAFASLLKRDDTKSAANAWQRLMSKLNEPGDSKFDRTDLAEVMPELELDRFIEASDTDFRSAKYLHIRDKEGKAVIYDVAIPVKGDDTPPLVRQASVEDLSRYQAKSATDRRTFFRTWVRAIKKK
ncbi:MAG: hypothetical protein M3N47_01365 [Chloroflexota bacterium]|nr:hypothetical protein [Chloroflexota bacterium]